MPRNKCAVFDLAKRVADVLVSASSLIILSPILGATALSVRVKLGRPIFFRQERPGRNGTPFKMVKFRTMLQEDPTKGLMTNEDRMTNFGKKLRSTSLDELPTLWNVLVGDMSLIGPRPLLMRYLPLYTEQQARRHEVRPGITGLAQASGRNGISWERRFELDVKYVEERSIMLDLEIVAKTISGVLRREGITTPGFVVGSPFQGTDEKHG